MDAKDDQKFNIFPTTKNLNKKELSYFPFKLYTIGQTILTYSVLKKFLKKRSTEPRYIEMLKYKRMTKSEVDIF